MKFVYAFSIFIAVPVILFAMLLTIAIPLVMQHFFTPKSTEENAVYPYLTSWEEAAA